MQSTSLPAYGYTSKDYFLLTKPGIIFGNILTTIAGFTLASRGSPDWMLFWMTLVGVSLVIGSACVFNNYIDREADRKMQRTQRRALVSGAISQLKALLFGAFLGLMGLAVLLAWTNGITVSLALIGFLIYVILYSFSKYYSIHGTLIGSVAGALPPVIGYCAVRDQLDAGAFLLFALITVWQMPHFFAIAIYRLQDYAAASIPVLPLKKGLRATKKQMLLYIVAFIMISFLFANWRYVNFFFLVFMLPLTFVWLGIAIQGFKARDDVKWARWMFVFSLVVVMGFCFLIPFTAIR